MYLLTAIGLLSGGSSTVHIYTQTIQRTTQNKQYTEQHKTNNTQNNTKQTLHRTTQNKQYIEKHKKFGRVRAVPLLCGFYPGICLTTEEKARKNLSQGSRRVPAGTNT